MFPMTTGGQVDQHTTGLADKRHGAAQRCATRYYDAVCFFVHRDAKRLHIQLRKYSELFNKNIQENGKS